MRDISLLMASVLTTGQTTVPELPEELPEQPENTQQQLEQNQESSVVISSHIAPPDFIKSDNTLEVIEEDLEHQFFFVAGGNLDVTTGGFNLDSDGNILGTTFTLTTGAASTGTYTVTLVHEPTKPNTGVADAGGETDIETTFNVTIQ